MFYRCVSVHRGGVLSQHALQMVSQHALQQVWGGVSQHALQVSRPTPKGEVEGDMPGWGGRGVGSPGPHPRGKLRGIWSRPTVKGEIEGGSGPGPQPRRKLRGICPGGCLLLGGCLLWGVPALGWPASGVGVWRPPQQMATVVDGMHSTGMHSCLELLLTYQMHFFKLNTGYFERQPTQLLLKY